MLSYLQKKLGSNNSSQDDKSLRRSLLEKTPPRHSSTEEILARYLSEEQAIAGFSMMLANFSLRGGSWGAVLTAKRIMDARLEAPDYKRQVEEKRENKLRMS